jgi:5-formyltetrahydrofolate cyclo-ligase
LQKDLLRKEILSKIKSMMDEQRLQKSKAISAQLFQYLSSKYNFSGLKLGAYCPYGWEVRWHLSFKEQCQLSLPRMLENHGLSLEQADWSLLDRDTFELTESTKSDPEVLIVPGVAFDSTGARLGRGKGYYDRFLESFKGETIGVCYNESLVEGIPMHEHDKHLDTIITEDKIYRRSEE